MRIVTWINENEKNLKYIQNISCIKFLKMSFHFNYQEKMYSSAALFFIWCFYICKKLKTKHYLNEHIYGNFKKRKKKL